MQNISRIEVPDIEIPQLRPRDPGAHLIWLEQRRHDWLTICTKWGTGSISVLRSAAHNIDYACILPWGSVLHVQQVMGRTYDCGTVAGMKCRHFLHAQQEIELMG